MTWPVTKSLGGAPKHMLYIVATPIGNLEDLTLRAINALSNADLILCEDTRVTVKLLEKYNIKKPLFSYHQHSGEYKIRKVIDFLKEGKVLALVTDAGTPGINDPGNFLIQEILKELPEEKIVPLPGPNAAVTALSVSGFHSDRFVFLGFPPHKKGRQTFFRELGQIEETIVFYESKYRIDKMLKELRDVSKIGLRSLVICRELTKQFETIYRGTIETLADRFKGKDLLGEFVIVISVK